MPGPLSSGPILNGFPAQGIGDRVISVVDHKGPASYASVVTGAPPSGGDSLTAAECGMKYIEAVFAGLSDDGTYNVEASPTVSGGGAATSAVLMWITANTGAQVGAATNLSARTIRCLVIGR
jgi:hypothetical protein